jgi:hypothetical protein
MQISILIWLNYVPKIFQKQDLAVAKARVVVVLAQQLLQIIRDYVLTAHLYLYVNISGELEVGLLLQLLHFTFCLTKIKLTIISSPIILFHTAVPVAKCTPFPLLLPRCSIVHTIGSCTRCWCCNGKDISCRRKFEEYGGC